MLKIETLDLYPYLTDYQVSQGFRGVEEVETMAGSIYRYGTGTGYVIQASLRRVPASVISELLNIAGSPEKSFSTTFYAKGGRETAECYAERIDTALIMDHASGGIWAVEMEVRTV